MRAIILSAGQGKRLLPLTASLPKCLLPVAGRSVLEWQLRALRTAGVDEVAVVTGFGARQVDAEIASCSVPGLHVRSIHNTLYDKADNLVSCLSARSAMANDFLLVNGDTLFQAEVVTRLLASDASPVAMAIANKSGYDEDDMKVQCTDGLVGRVGKDLPSDIVDGEAIGLSLFRGDGPNLFLDALETIAAQPDGHARWYLSAVSLLAGKGFVRSVAIGGLHWIEIDYMRDLERARTFLPLWPGHEAAGGNGHESGMEAPRAASAGLALAAKLQAS